MNSLLIIDDMAEKLKNKDIAYTLNRLIQNRRHKRLYIMILVQVYNKLPVSTRKLIDQLFVIGKPVNKKETQNIFEELVYFTLFNINVFYSRKLVNSFIGILLSYRKNEFTI